MIVSVPGQVDGTVNVVKQLEQGGNANEERTIRKYSQKTG
jgi:hypothetical protein